MQSEIKSTNVIQLSDHFDYKRLIRFTLPSVAMMVFTSLYTIVDGYFVSNFVGKTPFAALNLIYPYVQLLTCFGFIFGTGGAALIAKTLGEGDREKANGIFSFVVYVSIASSVVLAALGWIFLEPAARLLGAEGEMLDDCITYGSILLFAAPVFTLQTEFPPFFVTAEKPKLGLFVTVVSGLTNMALDAIFVGFLSFGLAGAAYATVAAQLVGGAVPLIYFGRKNSSLLRLGKPRRDMKALGRTVTNGASEVMTSVSLSLVSMLYNVQLLKFEGEDGVAAYGALMYLNFIFISIFLGYSSGVSPVISYHYGAKNREELKGLLKKSVILIGATSLLMLTIAEFAAGQLSYIFVGYDEGLLSLTERAFFIYAFSFPFVGFAIYSSAFFTALNNGLVSAIISFLRTFFFEAVAVLILPLIFATDGIWMSGVVSELLAAVCGALFIFFKRKKYGYL